ncbi:MAG: YqgE/AlgH family protein [Verrucomicrobiota bacterium]
MREFQQSSLGLAGSLLIAHPNLLDPNFRRTVLFIAAHDASEGSFGLVLNRESDKTVGEVLIEPGLGPLARVPVFFGGPVGKDRLNFAAFRWRTESQLVECQMNLDLDAAKELALDEDIVLRAFIGYSGWSSGQLEAELEQKAWVVQKPDRDVLDPESCKQLWFSIMQNYGPWFRLLASAPDDPSLN